MEGFKRDFAVAITRNALPLRFHCVTGDFKAAFSYDATRRLDARVYTTTSEMHFSARRDAKSPRNSRNNFNSTRPTSYRLAQLYTVYIRERANFVFTETDDAARVVRELQNLRA